MPPGIETSHRLPAFSFRFGLRLANAPGDAVLLLAVVSRGIVTLLASAMGKFGGVFF